MPWVPFERSKRAGLKAPLQVMRRDLSGFGHGRDAGEKRRQDAGATGKF